ncbi:hypothetical protein TWF192_010378 [Orbilia oligospora]|nr:hypothetical protein TWF192_010378 [Orbilia oligospora]
MDIPSDFPGAGSSSPCPALDSIASGPSRVTRKEVWMQNTIDNVKAKIQEDGQPRCVSMGTMSPDNTAMHGIRKEGYDNGLGDVDKNYLGDASYIMRTKHGSNSEFERHCLNGKTITLDMAPGYSQGPGGPFQQTSPTPEKQSLLNLPVLPARTDQHCYSSVGDPVLSTISFSAKPLPSNCGVDEFDWNLPGWTVLYIQTIVNNLLSLRQHVSKVIDNFQEESTALPVQDSIDISRFPYHSRPRRILRNTFCYRPAAYVTYRYELVSRHRTTQESATGVATHTSSLIDQKESSYSNSSELVSPVPKYQENLSTTPKSLVFHEWPDITPPWKEEIFSNSFSTDFPSFDEQNSTISTPTQISNTPNMEAHHNFDQIPFGNDLFNYPLSDPTMSFDWLNADDINNILNFTFDQQIFTQARTGYQTSEHTAPLSPASLAPSSSNSSKKTSTKRKQSTIADKSMLFFNEKTGLLSPNITRFTPSTTQSPNTNGPRSPSPAPQDVQQQSSQTSSNDSSYPQPYVCEHCKAPFRFSRDYWQHKAQAHNDFRFRCQLGCGKGFARHDNLVQHHRESKRHRRSPSPVIDAEEFSRRKKARKTSLMTVESDEPRFDSPLTSSFGGSSDTASNGTPRDAENDASMHPDYLRLQRDFELLSAKYELLKKKVNTLTEEKEEWEAREYIRRGRGRE